MRARGRAEQSPGSRPREEPHDPRDDPSDDPSDDPRDDEDLLRAHVAGDAHAFEELVRRHSARLWALAAGVLRDRDEASDALQDAFVSALRGAAAFRGDAAVSTWLHRIVVNACLDRLRRARARPTVPLDAPLPGGGSGSGRAAAERVPAPGDLHARVEVEVDVRAALADLPVHQRAALVLVDLHDMPVAEAADVLGVAVGTVKSRCARGRAAMAEVLRGRGLDPRTGTRPVVRPGASARPGPGGHVEGNRAGARDVPGEETLQRPAPYPPLRAGPRASRPRGGGSPPPGGQPSADHPSTDHPSTDHPAADHPSTDPEEVP